MTSTSPGAQLTGKPVGSANCCPAGAAIGDVRCAGAHAPTMHAAVPSSATLSNNPLCIVILLALVEASSEMRVTTAIALAVLRREKQAHRLDDHVRLADEDVVVSVHRHAAAIPRSTSLGT